MLIGSAYPAWILASSLLRPRPAAGAVGGLVEAAALWFAGFIVPLALTLLPPRGRVVPDGRRALRGALLMGAAALGARLISDGTAVPRPQDGLPAGWLDYLLRGVTLGAPAIATAQGLDRQDDGRDFGRRADRRPKQA